MKKIISILLILTLIFSCIPAFAAGAEITSVTVTALSSDKAQVSVTTQNTSGAYLLAAGYTEDGSMVSSADVSCGNAVLSTEGVKTVKVFCWDSAENMIPLCEPYLTAYPPEEATPSAPVSIEGVVISTYCSEPYFYDESEPVTIIITNSSDPSLYQAGSSVSFIAAGNDVSSLLGRSVSAKVYKNTYGTDEIISISENAGLNSVTVIDPLLIDSFDRSSLSYYKTNTATSPTAVTLENTLGDIEYDNIVINGFNSLRYDIGFDIFSAYNQYSKIYLLNNDNDSNAEFVFVDVYTEYSAELYIDEVSLEDSCIYDINGDYFEFDCTDTVYTVIKNSLPASFEDICRGDIITIYDTSASFVTIYVSSLSVTGVIDEIDDNICSINGSDYSISPCCYFDLYAGDEGIFHLNYLGQIVYAELMNPFDGDDFYFILDADESTGSFGEDDYLIKALAPDNTIKVFTLASRVNLYYNSYEYETYRDSTAIDHFYSAPFVSKLKFNSNGEVSSVLFEGSKFLKCDETYTEDPEYQTQIYSKSNNSYGKINFDADTVLFNINTSVEDIDDAVTACSLSEGFSDGFSYSFVFYTSGTDSAVLAYNALPDSGESDNYPIPSFSDSEYVYLIDAATEYVAFGDYNYLVKALTADNETNVYTIAHNHVYGYAEDFEIENSYDYELFDLIASAVYDYEMGTVAKITTDSTGCINGVWLPGCGSIDFIDTYALDEEEKAAKYSSSKYTYGTVKFDKNTILFNIDYEEEYDVSAAKVVGSFKNNSSYNFVAYGGSGFTTAEVVVAENVLVHTEPAAPLFSNSTYVYLIDAAIEYGAFGDYNYLVKAITADNEIKVYTIAPRHVYCYAEDFEVENSSADELYDMLLDAFWDSGMGSLAKITTDSEGRINGVWLPGCSSLAANHTYEYDFDEELSSYSSSSRKYGTITFSTSTVLFDIDTDEFYLEDAVSAHKLTDVFKNGSSYSFIYYGSGSNSAVVSIDATHTYFNPEAPVMLITSVTEVVYEGDITYKLTGISAGKTVSLIIDPDEAYFEELEEGYVIIYKTNFEGTLIDEFYILYDSNSEDGYLVANLCDGEEISPWYWDDECVTIDAGYITYKSGSTIKLNDFTGDDDRTYTLASGCNVILVESNASGSSASASTTTAVKTSTASNSIFAFVKTKYGSNSVTDIIVYKNFE